MSAPRADEIEISLFGPGVGECVVVHLCNNEWMVIDSCMNERRDAPIALDYLRRLGVDPANDIKLVVVSHWHDDHVRGMAEIVAEATSAEFVCSAALNSDEFFTLVEVGGAVKLVSHRSGVSEFDDILEHLHARPAGRTGPHRWAQEGLALFRSAHAPNAQITALSPSTQTITDSKLILTNLIPKRTNPIKEPSPNEIAVAVHVAAGTRSLLLGSDLETGRSPHRGWHAVVASAVCPRGPSSVFKVAHHGSPNADHASVWSDLLEPNPLSVMTPYAKGKTPRPTMDDVKRIASSSSVAYCTKWPITQPSKKRPKTVGRKAAGLFRKVVSYSKVPGHIRIRCRVTDHAAPRVEVFNGARSVP